MRRFQCIPTIDVIENKGNYFDINALSKFNIKKMFTSLQYVKLPIIIKTPDTI